ncbi:pyruvate synthase [candidate division LCP-89 bacterium B3_LCP]|uniref:Pyruvate synthase n=1 Tax=candidate division LCP-89 bacterium B3_LCP TaxID=2012998 RepID=A0A532V593_UNCL8|nr:MAG: pyruvate synthase [candidate division LCP-89 bacterium B3_LCP]
MTDTGKKMLEIRWHGRGGQGAVTASKVLAESAMSLGKQIQAFPEYGSERQGAPVKAFTRIADQRIRQHNQVTEPDVVIVLDPTLLDAVDVTEGLMENGTLIINTESSPAEIRQQMGLKGRTLYTVDATGISLRNLGKAIPNTPMIGALVGAMKLLDPKLVAEDFRVKFQGKFKDEIIEGNVQSILDASKEVRAE